MSVFLSRASRSILVAVTFLGGVLPAAAGVRDAGVVVMSAIRQVSYETSIDRPRVIHAPHFLRHAHLHRRPGLTRYARVPWFAYGPGPAGSSVYGGAGYGYSPVDFAYGFYSDRRGPRYDVPDADAVSGCKTSYRREFDVDGFPNGFGEVPACS